MMDNCSLDHGAVKGIQDDLNYYVDNNQEPDFYENEMMYDDLDLEEVQSNVFPTTGQQQLGTAPWRVRLENGVWSFKGSCLM